MHNVPKGAATGFGNRFVSVTQVEGSETSFGRFQFEKFVELLSVGVVTEHISTNDQSTKNAAAISQNLPAKKFQLSLFRNCPGGWPKRWRKSLPKRLRSIMPTLRAISATVRRVSLSKAAACWRRTS